MTDTLSAHSEALKTRETRLRRAAGRQGLRLEKSRARDPRSITYGTYMLVDATTNGVMTNGGPEGYGLSLDEIEDALTEPTSGDETRSRYRQTLADAARNTGRWREMKAEEHPEDARNAASAAQLYALAEVLDHLPISHPALTTLDLLGAFYPDDVLSSGAEASRYIGRTGFGHKATWDWSDRRHLDMWLGGLLEACERDADDGDLDEDDE